MRYSRQAGAAQVPLALFKLQLIFSCSCVCRPANPPIDRGSDDSRWCGPDCQLGWIVALCILIPCCCCIAFGYHLRRRSLAAANAEYAGGVHAPATYGQPAASPQAGFMGAVGPIFSSWFGGPAPSRPLTPPRDYSAGEPRVPPNSPEGAATGAYPGMAYPPKEQLRGYSGETQAPGMWTGEPHKLSEGEQQLEKQQQHEYKSNGPHRPQPTYAGPPPSHSGVYPTAAADAPSSSSFASEAHHPVAAPIRRTDHEEHAPGGAPVPVETSREPPPPYVP